MTRINRQPYLDALGLTDWQRRADGSLGGSESTQSALRQQGAATDVEEPAAPEVDKSLPEGPAVMNESTDAADAGLPSACDWDELAAYLGRCDHRGASQPVIGDGARVADVLIVGEAPGAEEDRQGLPFVGRSGQLLDRMLAEIDCSRESNVFITNICKFRPPDNRDPTAAEVATDWPVLERQIELIEPTLVVAAGRVAAQTLLQSSQALARLRGTRHRYPGRPLDVIVTYHPAFLLRSPQQKSRAWADLCAIADHIDGHTHQAVESA